MKRILTFLVLILLPCLLFAEPKIIPSKTKLLPGEQFTVQFSGGPGDPNSWIGVIPSKVPHGKENTNDANDVSYVYTPQADGSAPMVAPTQAGSYDLRWNHSGAEIASVTIEVESVDYKPVMRLKKNTFNPGDPIDLDYSVAVPLPQRAWIGLIPSDTPHGKEAVNDQFDIAYFYLQDRTSGTLQFKAPEKPGSYDFRLNDTDNNGIEVASVTFQVASVKLEGTMKMEKDVYVPGERIVLNFTAPEALSPQAWIGIVPSEIPHGNEEVNDQHDIQYHYMEKKGSGQMNFFAPSQAGSYDFRMNSSDSNGVEITSITFRVSGSLNSTAMAKAIAEQGRVVLYGIQFDFNKAEIKTESEPVLKEVGALLQNQPDLKLRVQGHTDNVGKSDYNLELSRKRAESVKAYLVQHFNVDGSRLVTEGFGDTKPIAKNDTEQGRAQNRRVELAKQ